MLTLTIARITLAEPKTAFAGVMLVTSFARLRTSINPFSVEMTPSLSSGRWDLACMVEASSSRKGTVRRKGCEKDSKSEGVHIVPGWPLCLVQAVPIWWGNCVQVSDR